MTQADLVGTPIDDHPTPGAVADRAMSQGARVLFVRHVCGAVISLAGTLILAWLLGPWQWGHLATAIFLGVAVEGILSGNGITAFVVRREHLTAAEEASGHRLQLITGIALFVLLVAGALAGVALGWIQANPLGWLLVAVGVAAIPTAAAAVPTALLAKRMDFGRLAVVELAGVMALYGFCLPMAALGCQAAVLGLGLVLRAVVTALLAYAWARPRRSADRDRATAALVMHESLPVALSNTGGWFVENIMPLVAGALLGTHVIGLYRIAYTLVNYPRVIAYVLARVLFSVLSSTREAAIKNRLAWRTFLSSSLILLVVLLSIAVWAPLFVPRLYPGPAWSGLSLVFLLAGLHYGFYMLCLIPSQALIAAGRSGLVLRYYAAHSVLMLAVVLAASRSLGEQTLPIAGIIASLANVWLLRQFGRTFRATDWSVLWQQAAIILPCATITWWLGHAGQRVASIGLWVGAVLLWLAISTRGRRYAADFFRIVRGRAPENPDVNDIPVPAADAPVAACPACGSAEHQLHERSNGFALLQCRSCDLVFADPMSSADGAAYDQAYRVRHFAIDNRIRDYYKWAVGHARAGQSVLDLGCGEGVFVGYARRCGLQAYGLDFSRRAIAIGTGYCRNPWIRIGAIQDLATGDWPARYDMVTAFEVIEHLEDPQGFLAEVRGCLNASGQVVFSVPNRHRWPVHEFNDYPPHHLTRWSTRSLARLLEQAGFEVVQCTPTSRLRSLNILWGCFARWLIYSLVGMRRAFRSMAKPAPAAPPVQTSTEAEQPARLGAARQLLSRLRPRQVRDALMWVPALLSAPLLIWFVDGYNIMIAARRKD